VDAGADESLDDDEDDVVDATPSIEQSSTRSSPAPCAGDEALAAFDRMVVSASGSSVPAGLLVPVLIFSTPTPFRPATAAFNRPASAATLDAAGALAFAAAGFGTIAGFDAAAAFGALAAFDAAPGFNAETTFFFPAIFTHFPAVRTPSSAFLFLVTSALPRCQALGGDRRGHHPLQNLVPPASVWQGLEAGIMLRMTIATSHILCA
jgi:hypothetical protein